MAENIMNKLGLFGSNVPGLLDKGLANLYNRDQLVDLENTYGNAYQIGNSASGPLSDARHMAAMNNLSNKISNSGLGIAMGLPSEFAGDVAAFGAGLINEIPALTRGFNKQNLGEIVEDIKANYAGSFGTPNSTTAEDIYSQVFTGTVPERFASGTPIGYGAAQAADLPTNSLERDFPGMSGSDIIEMMNNREFIGNQITPMAKPNVVDPNRIPGRIQEAVEPQYTIRGQIAEDFGEITNKIGSGLGSIRDFLGSGFNKAKEGIMDSSPMNFLRSLPTPTNLLLNLAATRNPLNPRSKNYNPTLQGQIDYMKDKGMYGITDQSGLNKITGGRLAGKNLVSLFGSNDLGEMYSKDLSKLQGYLDTMPQRFSRLRKNDPFSYNKKIENLQNKIKQNKIEAQAAQAAREAATAARAMARNPEVYRNAGITSGGFASQNYGTNENFSNRTGRGRTGYSEGGLASMFTRRG
jgi:hypothetical protein